MMTESQLKTLHTLQHSIEAMAGRAANMHNRMLAAYLDGFAKEAGKISECLAEAARTLSDVTGEMVSGSVNAAWENSDNMLKAMLAGAAIASKDPAERHVAIQLYDVVDEPHGHCEDCGVSGQALLPKGDHHGGTKIVCADRDACHGRRP